MGSESPGSMGAGRRCARHGLATAPDGMCALCRSETLPRARSGSTRVLAGVFAGIALLSTGAVAYRAAKSSAPAAISQEPSGDRGSLASDSVATSAKVELSDPTTDSAPPSQATTIPLTEPLPPPAVADLAPSPSAMPSATRPAGARGRPPPSSAELQRALSTTPIVMYTASWCGVCRKAKLFLNANGLHYQEIDADTTPGGWDSVERLTGHRGVPVIVVDGDVSAGLDARGVMRSVARSMERRLGVTGITFDHG